MNVLSFLAYFFPDRQLFGISSQLISIPELPRTIYTKRKFNFAILQHGTYKKLTEWGCVQKLGCFEEELVPD